MINQGRAAQAVRPFLFDAKSSRPQWKLVSEKQCGRGRARQTTPAPAGLNHKRHRHKGKNCRAAKSLRGPFNHQIGKHP
jgi:hypothetical protein